MPLVLIVPRCSGSFVKERCLNGLVSPGFEDQMVKIWIQ